MIVKKIGDFTGYSSSGLNEAIEDALEQVGDHAHFELIETFCSHGGENERQYEVTLTAFGE